MDIKKSTKAIDSFENAFALLKIIQQEERDYCKRNQDIVHSIILSLSDDLNLNRNVFQKRFFLKNESFFLKVFFLNSDLNLKESIISEIYKNNQQIINLLSSIPKLSISNRIWFFNRINEFKISNPNIKIDVDIDFLTNYKNSEVRNLLTYIGHLFFNLIQMSKIDYNSINSQKRIEDVNDNFLKDILDEITKIKLVNYFDKPFKTYHHMYGIIRINEEIAEIISNFTDCLVLFYSNLYYSSILKSKVDLTKFFISNKAFFGEQIVMEKITNVVSYKWISKNPKSLNNFYKALVKENLFENQISFDDFKICFENVEASTIKNTIKFKLNISEILFMILILMQKELIFEEKEWDYIRLKFIFNLDSSTHNLKSLNGKIDKRIKYTIKDVSTKKKKQIIKLIESII